MLIGDGYLIGEIGGDDCEETCSSCNGNGYLEVCIDADKVSDKWENQWCDECWVINPDYDPPKLKDY